MLSQKAAIYGAQVSIQEIRFLFFCYCNERDNRIFSVFFFASSLFSHTFFLVRRLHRADLHMPDLKISSPSLVGFMLPSLFSHIKVSIEELDRLG